MASPKFHDLWCKKVIPIDKMGVFGTVWANTTNGTELEHQGTVQDEVMNYLLGVCLVLLMPIGIFSNILVFR